MDFCLRLRLGRNGTETSDLSLSARHFRNRSAFPHLCSPRSRPGSARPLSLPVRPDGKGARLMTHSPARLWGLGLLTVLALAGASHADEIHWSSSWSSSPAEINA